MAELTDALDCCVPSDEAAGCGTATDIREIVRFAISDVIADADMDDATRADMAQWTGCTISAVTRERRRDLHNEGIAERQATFEWKDLLIVERLIGDAAAREA